MPTIKDFNSRELRLWSLTTDAGIYARRIAWATCPPVTRAEAEQQHMETNMSRYLRHQPRPVYALWDYTQGDHQ